MGYIVGYAIALAFLVGVLVWVRVSKTIDKRYRQIPKNGKNANESDT